MTLSLWRNIQIVERRVRRNGGANPGSESGKETVESTGILHQAPVGLEGPALLPRRPEPSHAFGDLGDFLGELAAF